MNDASPPPLTLSDIAAHDSPDRRSTDDSFRALLSDFFHDGGSVIPRVDTANTAPTPDPRDVHVHALTLVQPDGDIVVRIDEHAPPAEIAAHLRDVSRWIADYQETFRRRVLDLQAGALAVVAALPQLWSAAVASARADWWTTLIPLATLALIALDWWIERTHPQQTTERWYRRFRRWRDGAKHGRIVAWTSGIAAFATAAVVFVQDNSVAVLAAFGALAVVVFVAVRVVINNSESMLEDLRARFL